eukprot:5401479-Pyramimonas_sp.AAC.1
MFGVPTLLHDGAQTSQHSSCIPDYLSERGGGRGRSPYGCMCIEAHIYAYIACIDITIQSYINM